MKEQLISLETAKLAKQKGFNVHTMFYAQDEKQYLDGMELYQEKLEKLGKEKADDFCSWKANWPLGCSTNDKGFIYGFNGLDAKARLFFPTQALLQKWLREKHNIIAEVVTYYDEDQLPLSKTSIQKPKGYFAWDYYSDNFTEEKAKKFDTYEDALEEGLLLGLSLIEDEHQESMA